jgi:hypothetical protein
VKTSPKRSYSVIENERIGLVFAKTVSIISGTAQIYIPPPSPSKFQHGQLSAKVLIILKRFETTRIRTYLLCVVIDIYLHTCIDAFLALGQQCPEVYCITRSYSVFWWGLYNRWYVAHVWVSNHFSPWIKQGRLLVNNLYKTWKPIGLSTREYGEILIFVCCFERLPRAWYISAVL